MTGGFLPPITGTDIWGVTKQERLFSAPRKGVTAVEENYDNFLEYRYSGAAAYADRIIEARKDAAKEVILDNRGNVIGVRTESGAERPPTTTDDFDIIAQLQGAVETGQAYLSPFPNTYFGGEGGVQTQTVDDTFDDRFSGFDPTTPVAFQGERDTRQFFGDKEEFFAQPLPQRTITDEEGNVIGLTGGSGFTPVPMRYTDESAAAELTGRNPTSLANLQRQLKKAGFNVEPNGRIDNATISAFSSVMGHANAAGVTWQEQLIQFQDVFDQVTEEEGITTRSIPTPVFAFDPYSPPDYDTIAQDFKRWARSTFGHDPLPHELDIIYNKAREFHRSDYDQQYNAARQKFEQEVALAQQAREQQEGLEEGQEPTPIAGGPTTTSPDVDPQASFLEFLEDRYANQIDRVEQLRHNMESRQTTIQSLMGMSGMVSGDRLNEF